MTGSLASLFTVVPKEALDKHLVNGQIYSGYANSLFVGVDEGWFLPPADSGSVNLS